MDEFRFRGLIEFERAIGTRIPLHPNIISSIKLFVITPLLILSIVSDLPSGGSGTAVLLFFCFAILDYLDGVVAREAGKATSFGNIYDKVTDYPLLLALALICLPVLPAGLLIAKLTLEFLHILISIIRSSSVGKRLRVGINYMTLLVLMFLGLGIQPRFITPELVTGILWINVFFNIIVCLFNAELLHKRFIADVLSLGNLLCGCFSIYMAYLGRIDMSLVFLMLGAGFDGLDGAAARKFGSTEWGNLTDDIADAINYGIAPGVAVALHFRVLGSPSEQWMDHIANEGLILGGLYVIFTIGRLSFFTLNKDTSDPEYFRGVPSTIGGIVVLSATYLFKEYPAILGLMVGVACVLMVSFDARYRHKGRVLASHRRLLLFLPLILTLFFIYGAFLDRTVPIALILVISLLYGFVPVGLNFYRARHLGT